MINTRGFNVDILPSYTPVNPSLVAFNPTQFSSGALSGLQIADTYNKLKAYQAAQQELADTRDKRVQSTNLGYDANMAKDQGVITTQPLQTNLDVLKIQGATDAQPLLNKFNVGQAQSNLDIQPYKSANDLGAAQAAYTALDDTTAAQIANANAARSAAEAAVKTAPIQGEVDYNALTDKLLSAKTDKERHDLLEEANIAHLKAQAEEEKAKAQFELGLGRQTGSNRDQTNSDISSLDRAIASYNSTKLPDGRTLPVYENDTYNPDGTLKGGSLFGFGPSPVKDKHADSLIAQRNALEAKRSKLVMGDVSSILPSNQIQQQTSITPITVPGFTPNAPVKNTAVVVPQSRPTPNAAAVAQLLAHPEWSAYFDQKYGPGSAAKFITTP